MSPPNHVNQGSREPYRVRGSYVLSAAQHAFRPMPHDHHDHSHAGHQHAAPPPGGAFSMAFASGIALNLAFVVAETIGGLAAHSAALLADAGHNLSDVLSLAWPGVRPGWPGGVPRHATPMATKALPFRRRC